MVDHKAGIKDVALQTGKEILRIPQDAVPPQVRRTILERLRDCDYVPRMEDREAFGLLLDVPLPVAACTVGEQGDWEPRLRAEIYAYCNRFWDLFPAERLRQWDELAAYCGNSPRLRSHLQMLRPALDFELPDLQQEPPAVRALGRLLCDLCVMLPHRRAWDRRRRLGRLRFDSSGAEMTPAAGSIPHAVSRETLVAAAEHLARVHPRLAELDGGICVRELLAEPAARASKQRSIRPFLKRASASRSQGRRESAEAGTSRGGVSLLAWIAISVVVGLSKLVTQSSSDHNLDERLNTAARHAAQMRELQELVQRPQESHRIRPEANPVLPDFEKLMHQRADVELERLLEVERAVDATRRLEGRPVDAIERRKIAEQILQRMRETSQPPAELVPEAPTTPGAQTAPDAEPEPDGEPEPDVAPEPAAESSRTTKTAGELCCRQATPRPVSDRA